MNPIIDGLLGATFMLLWMAYGTSSEDDYKDY